jgi:hypothetical protein
MIFEALWDSARHGELILVDGGMYRWHLRADGQVTIREIISLRPGAGRKMLSRLKAVPGATSIFARCPEDLAQANAWYMKRGFKMKAAEKTRTGRTVSLWRLELENAK